MHGETALKQTIGKKIAILCCEKYLHEISASQGDIIYFVTTSRLVFAHMDGYVTLHEIPDHTKLLKVFLLSCTKLPVLRIHVSPRIVSAFKKD